MHECDLEKKDYINCLKSSGHQSEKCRHFSKKYLECRMENEGKSINSLGQNQNVELDGTARHVRTRVWEGNWFGSFWRKERKAD
uniref:CHCH domain-containing protein n=1 Tax=Manihot esculenta TaxID=3983 RepID=A0A2C9W255_MANES